MPHPYICRAVLSATPVGALVTEVPEEPASVHKNHRGTSSGHGLSCRLPASLQPFWRVLAAQLGVNSDSCFRVKVTEAQSFLWLTFELADS